MAGNQIPFSLDPLDKNLVLAKPKHSIDPKDISKLEEAGYLALTRKRDGHRHIVVISGNSRSNVRVYTRTMHEVTEKFPHLITMFYVLGIPGGTIIDTELVCESGKGVDDFDRVASLAKNSRAAELQSERGYARLIILNLVAYKNFLMTKESFSDRFCEMLELFERYQGLYEHAEPLEMLRMSFDRASKVVRAHDWEGLVLYDITKATAYRLDGLHDNPPRPIGCWKWKPHFEEDFVATHFVYGKGRNKHRMGKMYISQKDRDTGTLFSCGEVGVGFSDEQREYFADTTLYPLVVEVKYERRFKSHSLRFPVFLRERSDKTADECYPAE